MVKPTSSYWFLCRLCSQVFTLRIKLKRHIDRYHHSGSRSGGNQRLDGHGSKVFTNELRENGIKDAEKLAGHDKAKEEGIATTRDEESSEVDEAAAPSTEAMEAQSLKSSEHISQSPVPASPDIEAHSSSPVSVESDSLAPAPTQQVVSPRGQGIKSVEEPVGSSAKSMAETISGAARNTSSYSSTQLTASLDAPLLIEQGANRHSVQLEIPHDQNSTEEKNAESEEASTSVLNPVEYNARFVKPSVRRESTGFKSPLKCKTKRKLMGLKKAPKHEKNRPKRCYYCPVKFTCKVEFYRHIKSHLKEFRQDRQNQAEPAGSESSTLVNGTRQKEREFSVSVELEVETNNGQSLCHRNEPSTSETTSEASVLPNYPQNAQIKAESEYRDEQNEDSGSEIESVGTVFKCQVCPKSFGRFSMISSHVQNDHRVSVYESTMWLVIQDPGFCSQSQAYTEHPSGEGEEALLKCTLCDIGGVLWKRKYFFSHLSTYHDFSLGAALRMSGLEDNPTKDVDRHPETQATQLVAEEDSAVGLKRESGSALDEGRAGLPESSKGVKASTTSPYPLRSKGRRAPTESNKSSSFRDNATMSDARTNETGFCSSSNGSTQHCEMDNHVEEAQSQPSKGTSLRDRQPQLSTNTRGSKDSTVNRLKKSSVKESLRSAVLKKTTKEPVTQHSSVPKRRSKSYCKLCRKYVGAYYFQQHYDRRHTGMRPDLRSKSSARPRRSFPSKDEQSNREGPKPSSSGNIERITRSSLHATNAKARVPTKKQNAKKALKARKNHVLRSGRRVVVQTTQSGRSLGNANTGSKQRRKTRAARNACDRKGEVETPRPINSSAQHCQMFTDAEGGSPQTRKSAQASRSSPCQRKIRQIEVNSCFGIVDGGEVEEEASTEIIPTVLAGRQKAFVSDLSVNCTNQGGVGQRTLEPAAASQSPFLSTSREQNEPQEERRPQPSRREGSARFQCPKCNYSVNQKYYLKVHLLVHHRMSHKTVDRIMASAETGVSLNTRPPMITSWQCIVCSKYLSTAGTLRRHVKIHDRNRSARRSHSRSQCNRCRRQESSLTSGGRHRERGILLSPSIGRSAPVRSRNDQASRSETRIRKHYVCLDCPLWFDDSDILMSHDCRPGKVKREVD